MVPLKNPVSGGFKTGIPHAIARAGPEHLDIVDQHFSGCQEQDLQRRRGQSGYAGQIRSHLHGGPLRFLGLITVTPVFREVVIAVGIDQLQAAPAPVRPTAPPAGILVGDSIHQNERDLNRIIREVPRSGSQEVQ